jgi:hypothetical protein
MPVPDKANDIKNAIATATGVPFGQVSIILDHLGLIKSLEHRERMELTADTYAIAGPTTWRLANVTAVNCRIATSSMAE